MKAKKGLFTTTNMVEIAYFAYNLGINNVYKKEFAELLRQEIWDMEIDRKQR
jgi:hypothetical protein